MEISVNLPKTMAQRLEFPTPPYASVFDLFKQAGGN
jgi:hypothetical protein